MKKEGAIILGIGGDNSNGAAGTFYEGVMTSGYPSDATENAVQANIVAAGYDTGSGGGGATGPIVSGVNSAKCVDNNNGSGANGNKVQMWDCDGNAAAQNWTVNTNGTLHHRRRLPGHHRRQLQQRHPRRAVDLQRRLQPAMAGAATGSWSTRPPASASTTPTPTPPTAPSSRSGPATAPPTSNGACPDWLAAGPGSFAGSTARAR